MKVNIDDLEKILAFIFSKFRKLKGNEVNLQNDCYWDISTEDLYNPYEDPKNLTLGQLSDDVEEI